MKALANVMGTASEPLPPCPSTVLCLEASSHDVFLLGSAALANITFMDSMACDFLIQHQTAKILIEACTLEKADTLFVKDQVIQLQLWFLRLVHLRIHSILMLAFIQKKITYVPLLCFQYKYPFIVICKDHLQFKTI